MAIQRWRPWDDFRELERRMEDAIRNPAATFRYPLSWWRVPSKEFAWVPALEIYEKSDRFMVRAELPGMKEDDIEISVLGDTLTISGEKRASSEVKDEEYQRCEICYGSFSRSITLPASVKADKVEASYSDGVLEVTLPKAAEAKPKKISVAAKAASASGSKTKAVKSKTAKSKTSKTKAAKPKAS